MVRIAQSVTPVTATHLRSNCKYSVPSSYPALFARELVAFLVVPVVIAMPARHGIGGRIYGGPLGQQDQVLGQRQDLPASLSGTSNTSTANSNRLHLHQITSDIDVLYIIVSASSRSIQRY
jgi:hypothetical protein